MTLVFGIRPPRICIQEVAPERNGVTEDGVTTLMIQVPGLLSNCLYDIGFEPEAHPY